MRRATAAKILYTDSLKIPFAAYTFIHPVSSNFYPYNVCKEYNIETPSYLSAHFFIII